MIDRNSIFFQCLDETLPHRMKRWCVDDIHVAATYEM